jgi:hypothetical protein
MLRKNENGQQPWLPAVLGLLNPRLHRLPVSATAAAAVETATATMEAAATATTVEASATTVEATARGSAEPATTVEAVTTKSTAEATTTYKSATTHESPPADEPTTEATAKTPASPRATPAPPGAGADEHSTREPIRPIVAVRRTSVGRIAVVAVLARRRTPHIAHAHTYLRL